MAGPFANAATGFNISVSQSFSPFVSETESAPIQSRTQKTADLVRYGTPSVLAGMVDTFGTSLGLTDDGQIEQVLKENLPNVGDYYSRNREGAQTVGDLVGMFLPGTLAIKGLQRGSALYRATTRVNGLRSKLLNSVFTSAKTRDQLLQNVRSYDRALARNFQKDFSKDPGRRQLARRAQLTRIGDIAKETVAFELGVYATMNDSQTLYPDEFSTGELIALNAAIPAIFAGMETLATRRLLRASIQEVASEGTRNFTKAQLGDILYRPGHRDTGAVVEAIAAREFILL